MMIKIEDTYTIASLNELRANDPDGWNKCEWDSESCDKLFLWKLKDNESIAEVYENLDNEDLSSNLVFHYKIDGTDYYLLYNAPALARYLVRRIDNRIFEGDYQVIIEKTGLRIELKMKEPLDFSKIAQVAAKYGYPVSSEAFAHNFEGWRYDHKSGYLDDDKYFVFSACGCNKLYFHIEKYTGLDWQHTYYV